MAFRLPAALVGLLAEWQQQYVVKAGGVRPTPPESLHITLVFLGSQPAAAVPGIADTIRRRTAAARRPRFRLGRYRETPRVGMLTLTEEALPGDAVPGPAAELAGHLMLDFEGAALYRRESRDWRPHVTVARFRTPPRVRLAAPELGAFVPLDVALYHSEPGPNGSVYTVLQATPFAS